MVWIKRNIVRASLNSDAVCFSRKLTNKSKSQRNNYYNLYHYTIYKSFISNIISPLIHAVLYLTLYSIKCIYELLSTKYIFMYSILITLPMVHCAFCLYFAYDDRCVNNIILLRHIVDIVAPNWLISKENCKNYYQHV